MSGTYCSEVLSPAPTPRAQCDHSNRSELATDLPRPQVKVLLIVERIDGFSLQRLTDRGKHLGDTLHDTMDEAMSQAYCEYGAISDWRFCPDDVDPLQYIQAQSAP
jgi:hypothetical protein